MKQVTYDVGAVEKLLAEGKRLALAGDEAALAKLPKGNWIGGTIPYFMGEAGGVLTRDKVYVTEVPDWVVATEIRSYTKDEIHRVYSDAPKNGLSLIIIPAGGATHEHFALKAPSFESFATRPLVGWISGVHVDEIGKTAAKVFDGSKGSAATDGAVVLHLTFPDHKAAEIGIVNIFEPGGGESIEFPETGFQATAVEIGGQTVNFAEYLAGIGADTQLPLVADYFGARVNTSFQAVEAETRTVKFYAPVFAGVEYKLARPVGDYVEAFTTQMPRDAESFLFSCNCILNYLYSQLEGKKTGNITGPITFGEIAYQLVNQTLAYAAIRDV